MNYIGFRRRAPASSVDTFYDPEATMVDSASEHRKRSLKKLVWTQMDALIDSLRDFGIHTNDSIRDEALAYFTNRIKATTTDVGVLSDIEEEFSEAVRAQSPSREVICKINTFEFGSAKLSTWKQEFKVKDWPLIAVKHTQLTSDEEAEIDQMEIPQLLDIVRKECPEREGIIFPSGYDGMQVATMRRRVKNQLRLDLDELTEMTQDGSKLGKKAKVIDYLIKIRPGLIKGT